MWWDKQDFNKYKWATLTYSKKNILRINYKGKSNRSLQATYLIKITLAENLRLDRNILGKCKQKVRRGPNLSIRKGRIRKRGAKFYIIWKENNYLWGKSRRINLKIIIISKKIHEKAKAGMILIY